MKEAVERSSLSFPFRSISIGSEFDLPTPFISKLNPSEDEAARLLLSMSNIVSQEILNDDHVFDDDHDDNDDYSIHDDENEDDNDYNSCKEEMSTSSYSSENLLTSRMTTQSPTHSDDDRFSWNRVRTVSMDSPVHPIQTRILEVATMRLKEPALVTPIGKGRPIRKASLRLCQKAKQEQKLNLPKMPQLQEKIECKETKELKKRALQYNVAKGQTIKKILRKKFSWKNYPGKPISL